MKARAIETAREAMSQIKAQIDKMAELPGFPVYDRNGVRRK